MATAKYSDFVLYRRVLGHVRPYWLHLTGILLLSERGMRLSGGERQRISLARAFLKDAPVLVLDEPTSSVDTKTEAAIVEAMERLMSGRTAFIIAHRLTTLKHCDLLIRIEHGHVLSAEPAGAVAGKDQAVPDTSTYRRA